jgi:LSD1 subclass zinc finger protein
MGEVGSMSEADRRCETCGNHIDDEDLFCGNCGREGPKTADAAGGAGSSIEEGFVGFDCESCGASLTYDSEAEGLRCSFCGSVSLKRQSAPTGRIRADSYVPFSIRREDAVRAFEGWIAHDFFRPFGFKQSARVVSMQAVYVPFWSFRGRAHTYFAADTSRTPPGARASWCPLFGEHETEIAELLVCASGSLRAEEVDALEPHDFSRRRPYVREEIKDCVVEDFGLSRRGARPKARTKILAREWKASAEHVPGSSRNVHANTLVSDLRCDPVLLPVWINAYRFRDEVYRFCVNGQTGKLVGRSPFSLAKMALVILGVAVVAGAATLVAIGLSR